MVDRLRLKTPDGFDPSLSSHIERLVQFATSKKGPGWKFVLFDPESGSAHFERRDAVSSSSAPSRGSSTKVVSLGEGYGPNDGEKAAARFEALMGDEGWVMTGYDPFGGKATLGKLTAQEVRCRSACAFALGVKPWDVQVSSRSGGGYVVGLPASYSPAKHNVKLEEVATTVVGKPGWYLEVDVPQLRAEIIPAELPTFPAGIPYPLDKVPGLVSQNRLLFGRSLAPSGDKTGDDLFVTFDDGPHTMVQGTTGSGKSVVINALITGAVIAGMELVVVDLPAKAVDFTWCRDFVRPGGWGCESLEEGLAALDKVYREGKRRAALLKQHDVQKLSQLPDDVQAGMPRIFVVIDELAGILRKVNVPKNLDKAHPRRVEAERAAVVRDLTLDTLLRILAEMRFVGLHVLSSTQVATVNTGVPTELRDNSSNKLLLGVNASERNRNTALNQADLAPLIPEHIRSDDLASRGVGVAELPGYGSVIFKGLYASTGQFRQAVIDAGTPTIPLSLARPSTHDVSVALGEDGSEDFSGPPRADDPDAFAVGSDGERLRGAAAAAHASAKYARG